MLDKPVFDPEKLSIIDFKLLKGQIDTPEYFDIEKSVEFQLENTLHLGFSIEDKLVKSDYTVKITTVSKGANATEAIGTFHLIYIFKVENLEELAVPDEKGMIALHPSLGNALSSITYSTSRGILLTRLQGTALQNFILPVINPNKLLH